jgi:hypothetical protein
MNFLLLQKFLIHIKIKLLSEPKFKVLKLQSDFVHKENVFIFAIT